MFVRFRVRWFSKLKLKTDTIQLDNSEFHYQWLRDHCQCPKCIHPPTQQKLHSSGQIVAKKPIDARLDDSKLEIEWPEGTLVGDERHKSVYHFDFLKRFEYKRPFQPLIQYIPWDAQQYSNARKTIEFKEFLKPDGYQAALQQLRDYGLVFLRNVPADNELMVEQVAKKFGVIKNTFYGTSWNVKNDPNSKNIAYTSLFLGLHMDLMYFEAPPGLQLLHCLENTVNGGTSLFLDLFSVIDELKLKYPKEYAILKSVPVRFWYKNDDKYFEYLRPTIVEDVNDHYHIFYSPPFQGPLHCDPTHVNDFYSAFGVLESLIAKEARLYKYLLRKGDLVMFANRRVLHGRDSFDPKSGNRWLKGTYVGWDEIKDRIRMHLK